MWGAVKKVLYPFYLFGKCLFDPWVGTLSGLSDTFYIWQQHQANTGRPPWHGAVGLAAVPTERPTNDFGDVSLGQIKIKYKLWYLNLFLFQNYACLH